MSSGAAKTVGTWLEHLWAVGWNERVSTEAGQEAGTAWVWLPLSWRMGDISSRSQADWRERSSTMEPVPGSCSSTACWWSLWSPDPDSRNDSMKIKSTIRLILCKYVLLWALWREEMAWQARAESLTPVPLLQIVGTWTGDLAPLSKAIAVGTVWRQMVRVGFSSLCAKSSSLLGSQVGLQLALSGCQHGVTEHSCKYSLFLLSASLLTLWFVMGIWHFTGIP